MRWLDQRLSMAYIRAWGLVDVENSCSANSTRVSAFHRETAVQVRRSRQLLLEIRWRWLGKTGKGCSAWLRGLTHEQGVPG